jgi:hypothetical protein
MNILSVAFVKAADAPRPQRRTAMFENLEYVKQQLQSWPPGEEVVKMTIAPEGKRAAESVAAGVVRALKGKLDPKVYEAWHVGAALYIRKLSAEESSQRGKEAAPQSKAGAKKR